MSEVRFSASPQFQALPPTFAHGLSSGRPPGSGLAGPSAQCGPTFQPGSVASLMALNSRPAPHVVHAAPLLGVQSQTASRITHPSTSGQADDGVGVGDGLKGASTANAVAKALTRATSRLGQGTRTFGSVAGLAGSALALPGGISEAMSSLERARQTGNGGDIAHAAASTSGAGSTATRLVKHGLETYSLGAGTVGRSVAGRAAASAFRQAVPGASPAVVKAAAKQAGQEAMKETAEKLARRGVTSAATTVAKASGTLAGGAGAVGRTAAKKVLREGGEVAAKAAAEAVAKGALKTGAKTAGRFVPGLNIAIAGLDTAAALATLADPKASTGKKVTSCITAAGSVVAATNIFGASQIGAAVSTVSSFVGSFF